MNDGTEDKHQSYGMVGVSHVSSSGSYLVGTEFRHHHYVTLTICRASKMRGQSREWWNGGAELVSIALSEAQFVELMARPNMGDGVPCTLDHVMGERMPQPPVPVTEQAKHHADFKATSRRAVAKLDGSIAAMQALLDTGKIGKTALKEMLGEMQSARQNVAANLPFVEQSFVEHMEKTVNNAAAEIEATVTNIAIRLGVQEMKRIGADAPRLLDMPKEDARKGGL